MDEGKGSEGREAERRGESCPFLLGILDPAVEEGEGQGDKLGLGRPGTSFFTLKHCTQFCIAGLQESSHEEPKMHQNSWRLGFMPHPTESVYSASPGPYLVGSPSPRTSSGSTLRASSSP